MKLFDTSELKTIDGEDLIILHAGDHNIHAGPDFTNAKLKIGNTTWVGNVEIHLRSSDWNHHKHQLDDAYKNVILHVVFIHDDAKNDLPTFELKNRIDHSLVKQYEFLMHTSAWIPCEKSIRQVNEIIIKNQLSRMLAERLEEKALRYEQRLLLNKNDWEETAYQLLARSFGTNVNADPFERVAQNLSYHTIRRHFNNPMQIEALLFGQAGFLQSPFKEIYPHQLQSEYVFLQKKYQLEPIRKLEWKFLRLRPANFPTMRLSQFANFISAHDRIFQKMLESKDEKQLQKLFSTKASAYWKEHYSFKKSSLVKSTSLGKSTIDLILINTVAPLVFLYGHKTSNQKYINRAMDILEYITAENNHITKKWNSLNIKSRSAADSQALLYLKKEYCAQKRCLECGIGNAVLQKNIL